MATQRKFQTVDSFIEFSGEYGDKWARMALIRATHEEPHRETDVQSAAGAVPLQSTGPLASAEQPQKHIPQQINLWVTPSNGRESHARSFDETRATSKALSTQGRRSSIHMHRYLYGVYRWAIQH